MPKAEISDKELRVLAMVAINASRDGLFDDEADDIARAVALKRDEQRPTPPAAPEAAQPVAGEPVVIEGDPWDEYLYARHRAIEHFRKEGHTSNEILNLLNLQDASHIERIEWTKSFDNPPRTRRVFPSTNPTPAAPPPEEGEREG